MTSTLDGVSVFDRTTTRMGAACCRLLEALGAQASDRPERAEVVVADTSGDIHTGCRVSVRLNGHDGPSPAYGREIAAELAGAHAALATTAALRHARRRDCPVIVAVDQDEVVASCLGELVPRRICPRAEARRPAQDTRPRIVRCGAGYVGIATPTQADSDALATLTGFTQESTLEWHFASMSRDELVELGQLWRLPIVPVLSPAEVQRLRRLLAAPSGSSPFRVTTPGGGKAVRRPAGPLPLSDLLVLDLGMVWAGPWCGRLLAGLGAEVVKVEGPARPDGTRSARGSCSGVFGDLNRGKHSLVLDLDREEGRAAFLRLTESADALIENFSPRVMPNFGLDHELLARKNGLVVLSMPAFPSRGEWSGYVAYGGGLELAAGLAPPAADGVPEPAIVPYLDYLSGCYGAAAVVAAAIARDASGRGVSIELAQWALAEFLLRGNGCRPMSPRDGSGLDALLGRPSLMDGELLSASSAPDGHCHHYRRLPLTLSGIPTRAERAAPAFGADTRRVLEKWAGIGPAAFNGLVAAGIVQETSEA